ncbi:glycosyltransferase [Mycobacterium malmoense]|uniref:glycosyltransferase n=1 Tax=Mycobacterium malmoense TaxID=1780 RepID=UPI0009F2C2C0|nr:glycosyltransferase [Mycobacterium malmoense]
MTSVSPASEPKVSVVSIAYNHEEYIRDALDGFVAQEIDFSVEIVIADDASTDATATIIREYATRFPQLFRPILRSKNIGIHANLTEALSAARGEYLAICEGDDYWTDPMKLSKQVSFLDQHPETSLCFHPVQVVWTDGRKGSEFPPPRWRRDLSVDALIKRNFIQTNSVLYRRLSRYDDIPADVMPMDWYLHVRHAAQGGIAMLPETMAVYRRHPQSFWYGADVDREKFWVSHGRGHAAMFEAMLDIFPDDAVREELIAHQLDWILREIARVPGPEGRAALLDTIAHHPRSAMLALQRRWRSPTRRLRSLWRKLAPSARAR